MDPLWPTDRTQVKEPDTSRGLPVLSPPLFYDVFHVFSLQKARILRCFGGGNVPKNAFWCPKGTCLMWFSKLPLAAGTHCQKHCFLEGKYGFCGAKRIVFRSFRPPKLANVSAKSAPFVGSRHFAASGAPFVSVLKPKTRRFSLFRITKTHCFSMVSRLVVHPVVVFGASKARVLRAFRASACLPRR